MFSEHCRDWLLSFAEVMGQFRGYRPCSLNWTWPNSVRCARCLSAREMTFPNRSTGARFWCRRAVSTFWNRFRGCRLRGIVLWIFGASKWSFMAMLPRMVIPVQCCFYLQKFQIQIAIMELFIWFIELILHIFKYIFGIQPSSTTSALELMLKLPSIFTKTETNTQNGSQIAHSTWWTISPRVWTTFSIRSIAISTPGSSSSATMRTSPNGSNPLTFKFCSYWT